MMNSRCNSPHRRHHPHHPPHRHLQHDSYNYSPKVHYYFDRRKLPFPISSRKSKKRLCFLLMTVLFFIQLLRMLTTPRMVNLVDGDVTSTQPLHPIVVTTDFPSFVRDPKNDYVAMTSSFAKKPLTGYHTIPISDGTTSNDYRVYFPLVDLQDYYHPYDEVKDMLLQNQRINNGPNPVMPNLQDKSSASASASASSSPTSSSAVLTRRSFKGTNPFQYENQINQDRAIIMTKPNTDENQEEDYFVFMGIFDGHGLDGHAVSHYVALELPSKIDFLFKQKNTNFTKEMIQIFHDLDQHQPIPSGSGSTCSLLVQINPNQYMASSVGDSHLFIVSYNPANNNENNDKVKIVWSNKQDKPSEPEERQRIESMGGRVWIPPPFYSTSAGNQISSRVEYLLPNGIELALAMSRSIGDPDGSHVGVISQPHIDILTKPDDDDEHWFAIAASDGLLDYTSMQEIAHKLVFSLYHPTTERTLLQSCEELILQSSQSWIHDFPYRDDITIAVQKLF